MALLEMVLFDTLFYQSSSDFRLRAFEQNIKWSSNLYLCKICLDNAIGDFLSIFYFLKLSFQYNEQLSIQKKKQANIISISPKLWLLFKDMIVPSFLIILAFNLFSFSC